MKLQLLKFGEDGKRFLQLCSVWLLICFRSLFSLRHRTLFRDSLFFLCQLRLLTRLRDRSAIPCTALVFMMLLLDDFLGVRDVSWISHQSIDGSQRPAGRISQLTISGFVFARMSLPRTKSMWTKLLLRLSAFRAVEKNT